MKILVSHDEPDAVFSAVRAQFSAVHDVERGDSTCVAGYPYPCDDTGLFARVVEVVYAARGESEAT